MEIFEKILILIISLSLSTLFLIGLFVSIIHLFKTSVEEVTQEFQDFYEMADDEKEKIIKSWNKAIEESI